MARNPKLFVKGRLVEISTRIEEGLPLAPNKLIKTLLINVLARAQTYYRVRIVSYVFLENHFHLLIIVEDPSNVPDFVEYLKRESAYYINRLLGRRKHTVWCDGYDSPIILDSKSAINRLKYVYLNPVTAGLCKKGKDWLLSSYNWIDRSKRSSSITVRRIPRDKVPKLPHRDMTLSEINKACSKLGYRGKELYTLTIEPDAWMECFSDIFYQNPNHLNQVLDKEIDYEERRILREKDGIFPNLNDLATKNIRTPHQPTKFGKRMICIGSTKEIRVKFLTWFRDQCKKLPRFLRQASKDLIYPSHYPSGFFAPGGFLSSNLIPQLTPFRDLG